MTHITYQAETLASGHALLPRWWRSVDHWSLLAVGILMICGIVLGFAASPPLAARHGEDAFYYVARQGVFAAGSFVVILFLSAQSVSTTRRLALIGFALALVALVMLPWFGTDYGKGATRWYSLRIMAVQPSEFMKPFFIILSGWLMSASFDLNGPPGKSISFVVLAFVTGLLVMQPDFGQASLFVASWGLVYFVAGASIFLLLILAGLVLFGANIAYQNSSHFAARIDGFLNPEVDPTTQLGFATNAIREGGFFGVGAGEGSVKWSLPDAHTDFVIAVAAEEYGMTMVVLIMLCFVFIALRSLMRLKKERDPFVRLAGVGLVSLLALQAFINMGVAVRLLPAKGMTLPFVSYGGSSMLASGILVGFLLAFTRRREQENVRNTIEGKR